MTIIKARFNQGRWIADCPDCQGAELSHPGLDFVCLSECSEEAARQFRKEGKPITAENSNELIARMWKISRTFRRYQVEFPTNKTEIEEALEHRAFPEWRSWEWGMTVQELIDAEPFLHHSWTAPRTWVAGETVTAAIGNVHWRDNFNATAVAVVTTKGDLAVAAASVTLTRLAVGTNGAILVADSTPSTGMRWSSTGKTAAAGVLVNVDIATTLTAAANSDNFDALRIKPTIAKGAFTALVVAGIEVAGASWGVSGAGTIDTTYGVYISPATIGTTNWSLYMLGNSQLGTGKIFINDTTNANQTTGLTINMGTAGDEIEAFKQSNVVHGMTGFTETDSFAVFKQQSSGSGGLRIMSFTELTSSASLEGYGTTEDTTKSTAALGAVEVVGGTKSGTSPTTMGANSNIVVIKNFATARFIFDADGEAHEDVGTAFINFDEHDDIALLNLLAAKVTRKDDPVRRNFGKWLRENRSILEELKLVKFNRDGHHFINRSRTQNLLIGALRQVGAKLEAQSDRLLLLEKKVLQLAA